MLEKLGKYKISRKIGKGAMGEVFEAHDPVLNRKVAIKTISGDMGGDASLRKRFEREAQSAAQLAHPNIITVFDFGQEQDLLYMAMELLEGKDLKQAISRGSFRSLEQKLDVISQICDGMEVAHAQTIVHRDLKPANIHIQPDGQVKIMDFGLARLSGSEMTRTGMVMGTPNYMAPEQVRGERADTRSDIFALGCVFYEILSGRKPFDADSMHAVLFKVMQEAPVSLRERSRDVPVVLIQVVEKALAKDPALRFQHAGELREAVMFARQTIAEGHGFEPLPGLELPDPAALGAPAGADGSVSGSGSMWSGSSVGSSSSSASRSASGSTSGRTRSASVSTSRPASMSTPGHSSKAPLLISVVAVLAALAAAGYFFLGGASSRQAAQADNPLVQAVAGTQVDLARKKLEAGDYRGAHQQAERALQLAPGNEAAQAVLDEAGAIVERVDAAETALSAARQASDATAAEAALWELMQADPNHPQAADLAPVGEAGFQGRLDAARAAMNEAKQAATAAGAGNAPAFREGNNLAAQAEKDVAASNYGSAVRNLLRSRDRYKSAVTG